ncbi:MAG: rhodanese-like domain-containing protein [Campylobacteraceae bacterium]|nr:rhodanese-like domain-containing protein [Campylobacteraceae bacterium]
MSKAIRIDKLNLDKHLLIDIRSKERYLTAHIKNSLNLNSEEQILNFIKENSKQEYVFCCFTSVGAKQMAQKIASIVGGENIYYLDASLLEAKSCGFDIVELNIAS